MTEAEWLAANDPFSMVELERARLSDRKLRLFCCACCYRYTWKVDDKSTNAAAALLERYADGLVSEDERLYPNTLLHHELICVMWGWEAYKSTIRSVGLMATEISHRFNYGPKRNRSMELELEAQSALCRDIFGNPFRPVTLNPSWLTSTVLALANGIYNEKAFDRMPILADALQDAGCDNDEFLKHCREQKGHVRGCFVVDLLLGKE